MREHRVQADALVLQQHVHPDPQRGQSGEQLGAHEGGEVEGAVGGAQEQRPTLVEPGDRLPGQVVVGQQPAAVRTSGEAGAEQGLEHRRGVDVGTDRRGELGEQPDPGVELARAVVAVHHRDRVAGRSGDQVELVVHPGERVLQHHHGEDAGAGADVAGARRHRVGGDHARCRRRPPAGTAGRRAAARPVGSSRRAPASVSVPAASPARADGRQQVAQPPRQVAVGDQVVEGGDHGGVVAAGGGVDREHAAGVADPEHLLAGQLPVHVPGQRGQVRDPIDVGLLSRGPPGRGGRCSSGAGCCGRTPRSGPPRPGRCWCSARSGTGRAARPRRRRPGSRASWPTRPARRRRRAPRRTGRGRRRPTRRSRPADRTRRTPANRSTAGRRTGSPRSGRRWPAGRGRVRSARP